MIYKIVVDRLAGRDYQHDPRVHLVQFGDRSIQYLSIYNVQRVHAIAGMLWHDIPSDFRLNQPIREGHFQILVRAQLTTDNFELVIF